MIWCSTKNQLKLDSKASHTQRAIWIVFNSQYFQSSYFLMQRISIFPQPIATKVI